MYVVTLEYDPTVKIRAEVFKTTDRDIAHGIFDLLATRQRDYFKKYGRGKYEWFVSLYDRRLGDEYSELKAGDDGGPAVRRDGSFARIVYTYEIVTSAMRRRFLSLRELEGLDD